MSAFSAGFSNGFPVVDAEIPYVPVSLVGPAVSPVEIIRAILLNEPVVGLYSPGGVVVGPATVEQGRAGVIMVLFSGTALPEFDLPLYECRVTVVCEGPTIEAVERLSMVVYNAIHMDTRRVIQTEGGYEWLVHRTPVVVGPTLQSNPTEELWQAQLFVHLLVGTEPVTTP